MTSSWGFKWSEPFICKFRSSPKKPKIYSEINWPARKHIRKKIITEKTLQLFPPDTGSGRQLGRWEGSLRARLPLKSHPSFGGSQCLQDGFHWWYQCLWFVLNNGLPFLLTIAKAGEMSLMPPTHVPWKVAFLESLHKPDSLGYAYSCSRWTHTQIEC